MMMRRRGAIVSGLLLLAAVAPTTRAQYSYFGKNKVQTRDYAFQRLETEHFNVLFYPGGETMAEFAARSAEEYYRQLSSDLGIDLDVRVPLILYLSPSQFTETNVILDVIEEGVGGFSELFRNRIVVPFNGSYSDLHHVIGHELAHIFEFQMFFRSRLGALLGAIGEFQIPLWVLEGFAEFQSGWVNVESEVFMRDLVLSDRVVAIPELHDGLGYLVYREGEAIFRYVEEKYGRKKVYELLHSLKAKRGLDAAFASVFGMPVEKFNEEWERWLQVRYWPQVTEVANFERLARRLTDHREDGSVYNTAPAISPSGTKIAFVSDRSEYVDCYVMSAMDGRILRRLVRGGRTGGFETMHLLRPGVTWSPDEKIVALSVQSAGRDNIALVEYPSGRVRRRLATGLDGVYTPAFSTDGHRIVFVGLRNGFSDIYEVDTDGGEPRRITYDMYEDRDPSFSRGGDTLLFVSDRPDAGEEWKPGAYAVWMKTSGGQPRRITGRAGRVSQPILDSSGEYLFYVTADSAANVHVFSMGEGRVVRKTRFLGEVTGISLSDDGRKLALAYFSDVGWDIALLLDPLERIPVVRDSAYSAPADTATFTRRGLDFDQVKPVGLSLAPDYAVGAASYSVGGGLAGVVNVSFSDMLGNHRFELYTDVYGDVLNSDLIFQYWLLPFRIDWGFVLFQYRDYAYYLDRDTVAGSVDTLVDPVNRGLQVLAGYPLDRFLRAELGLTGVLRREALLVFDRSTGGGWYQVGERWPSVAYLSPALVFDNTYWTWDGPVRGTRARLGSDLAVLSSRRFYDIFGDFRNYLRIGRRFVFASRLAGLASFGPGADQFYIDGRYVRGYNWDSEFADAAGPAVGLVSLELRYPFVDHLKLAFPLPLEFGGIRGAAFLDGGLVASEGMRIWNPRPDSLQQERNLDDLKLGVGFGIRVKISYFSLIFDWAKPLSTTVDPGWKFLFGIGTDF